MTVSHVTHSKQDKFQHQLVFDDDIVTKLQKEVKH